jgi:hypothetical protein
LVYSLFIDIVRVERGKKVLFKRKGYYVPDDLPKFLKDRIHPDYLGRLSVNSD